MKVFATACLFGMLVAAFSVVAVIAHGEEAESMRNRAEAAAAPRPASAAPGAPGQLLEVMRELLDGRDVACERIVRPLLGLEGHAEVGDEQLFRLLLGLDADAEINRDHLAKILGIDAGVTVDCEWTFRTLLGLDEGEAIDNEQLVRLLLGIDDHEDLDTEQVLRLLETAADGRTGGRCGRHDRAVASPACGLGPSPETPSVGAQGSVGSAGGESACLSC